MQRGNSPAHSFCFSLLSLPSLSSSTRNPPFLSVQRDSSSWNSSCMLLSISLLLALLCLTLLLYWPCPSQVSLLVEQLPSFHHHHRLVRNSLFLLSYKALLKAYTKPCCRPRIRLHRLFLFAQPTTVSQPLVLILLPSSCYITFPPLRYGVQPRLSTSSQVCLSLSLSFCTLFPILSRRHMLNLAALEAVSSKLEFDLPDCLTGLVSSRPSLPLART